MGKFYIFVPSYSGGCIFLKMKASGTTEVNMVNIHQKICMETLVMNACKVILWSPFLLAAVYQPHISWMAICTTGLTLNFKNFDIGTKTEEFHI